MVRVRIRLLVFILVLGLRLASDVRLVGKLGFVYNESSY